MRSYIKIAILSLLVSTFTFAGCTPEILAALGIRMTDAPIDDPLYPDVYITIAGLEVNGEALKDFDKKKTLKVSELQNGLTAELLDTKVAEGSYDEITLILDFDEDENGNAPGCYVNTSYDRKIDLSNGQTGTTKISLAKALKLEEGEEANLVIDFDLRKAIRSSQPGDESELSLVKGGDLQSALRVVEESETGTLKGTLLSELPSNSQVNTFIVYAYNVGEFNSNQERFDVDGDGIAFENAVTSTLVNVIPGRSGEFSLHFLEEGSYHIVVEAYESEEFFRYSVGYLKSVGTEGLILPVSIQAQNETQINLTGIDVVQ